MSNIANAVAAATTINIAKVPVASAVNQLQAYILDNSFMKVVTPHGDTGTVCKLIRS